MYQWRFTVIISLLLSAPQVLKVRLNLQQAGTYYGVAACARSIYRHESLSSFYRGFKPSILCMIPYAGVECAVHQVRQSNTQRLKPPFICLILTICFSSQSIMNWAKSDPAYNSDSKLFFFSFVAFASGQMTSYPLAVIRTQQQAQGSLYIQFNTVEFIWNNLKSCFPHHHFCVLQLSARIRARLQAFYKDLWGFMKDMELEDIITAWEPASSGLFHVLW